MNENQSVQNVKNEPEKPKKKFSEKSFGGKILTLIKWGIIGYFSLFAVFIIVALVIPDSDNKDVSSTKDIEKVEVSDEKGESEVLELEDTYQEEVVEEEPVVEEPEPIETYDTRYAGYNKVNETYQYNMDNNSVIDFTITDWGTRGEDAYIAFHVKNEGPSSVTLGLGMFRVYADNKLAEMDYLVNDTFVSETVDSGRELEGRFYAKVNLNQIDVLELEVGKNGNPYILYDAELEAIAEEYERANYTGYVNIPADSVRNYDYLGSFMEVEEVSLYSISGYYVDKGDGTDLVQELYITLYDVENEDGCIGDMFFSYNGQDWSVPFIYCGNNYYTGGGYDVPGIDFAPSTLGDMVFVKVFIDGKSAGLLKREDE